MDATPATSNNQTREQYSSTFGVADGADCCSFDNTQPSSRSVQSIRINEHVNTNLEIECTRLVADETMVATLIVEASGQG